LADGADSQVALHGVVVLGTDMSPDTWPALPTVATAGRFAPKPRRTVVAVDRRSLERWSAALGGAALAGTFFLYVNVWVTPRYYSGDLDLWVRSVVDGTATAPYQYRVLVPALLVWLTDHAGASMAQATIVVDGSALALGTALGFHMLRKSGLAVYALPAAVYCGWLGLGLLNYAKPETLVAFAAVTAAANVVAHDAGGRARWLVVVVAAVVLAGCRTDLLVALGVGFGVRAWQRRSVVDAGAALALVVTALAATVALLVRYPDAKYPEGVHVVQLQHNLTAIPVVLLAAFLLPALGPLVLARAPRVRREVLDVASRYAALLAVVATEVVVTLVVGRTEEIRLLFPEAFLIALVGIELWRVVVDSIERADTPVA